MSQEIGPWSTHQKNFRAPLSRKKANSTFKKMIPNDQSTMISQAAIDEAVGTNAVQKNIQVPEQQLQQSKTIAQKLPQIHQSYLTTSTQIERILEQRLVLSIIRQELIKSQSMSILLPLLQQKSTNSSIPMPKVKKYSFQTQTINTVYPKYQRNQSQARQKIQQKTPDKLSSSNIVDQDPFNDNNILKRADALLQNYRKWRKQHEIISVKIKRK